MKKIYSFFLVFYAIILVIGQNSLNSGDFVGGSWGAGQSMSSSINGTLTITKSVSTSGDKYFRFYGDGSPCGEYQANNNGDFFNSGVKITSPNSNCGSGNAWRINVPTSTSNVVFKTDGQNDGIDSSVAFVIQGAIQTINSVSQNPVSSSVTNSNSVLVTATLSGNLSSGQSIYLRYAVNGNWSSSSIIEMLGSGINYTATIPVQATGTNVSYYLFSSGSGLSISSADADLYTINWNAGSVNGGSNYSYTVLPSATITLGSISGSPFCAGASVSVPYTVSGTFNSGNIFTAQLSNSSGSFASPINIGNVTSTTSGTISATIPANTVYGTGYKIRVVSNNPSATSNESTVFTINPIQFFANLETQNQTICAGNNIINGNVTGRLWIDGLTNLAGVNPNITVEFGYANTNDFAANIHPNNWTNWVTAAYKEQSSNDDRYTINNFGSSLPVGTYYYTFRYKVGNCDWVYGGYNSGNWNGTTNVNGTLTVNSATVISSQPSASSASYCVGSNISPLSVSATGNNLTYQWYSNSTASTSGATAISGATSSTYTPSNSSFSKNYYYVVVTGSCGTVTSGFTGLISVVPSVSWANIMSSPQTVCEGNNVTITGELWVNISNLSANSGYFEAQYAYNTSNSHPNSWPDNLPGDSWNTIATAPTFTNNNLVYTATFGAGLSPGVYYYSIRYRTSACGNWVYGGYNGGQSKGGFYDGTSNINGVFTINSTPTITVQPTTVSQTNCPNTSPTQLSVTASNASSYQWYRNSNNLNSGGTLVSGATGATYNPDTSLVGTTYYYYVTASNSCGSTTSNVSGAVTISTVSSVSLSSGNNNQTLLNDGTPISSIVYHLNNISSAAITGLPSGVSGVLSADKSTFTISGIPTQVGIFNYNLSFTAGCGTVSSQTGSIQVNSYLVEYANIQLPKKPQTILLGDQFDVYAQVKITGITDAPGYGSGASGWLGYSTTNTNPNTWTHWTAISYNPNYDTSPSYQIENDEYYYIDFVNNENLEGGTYYYASRFQRNGSSEYTYGGTDEVDTNFSGGIWGTTNANGKVNVSGVVKVVDEVIWDGTQWKWFDDDEGTSGAWKTIAEPNQKLKAKIEGNYPASAPSFTCKKLTVDNGVSVTIGAGKYIWVINEIVNNNTDASLFTVESDGSLIQVNDVSINTGSITVKRNALMKRLDYTYWGSPVIGQNLKAFSPATLDNRFFVYREIDDYFDGVFAFSKSGAYDGSVMADAFPLQDKNTYNFEVTRGYAIRAPNNFTTSNAIFNGKFVGVPNNGIKNFVLKCTNDTHGVNFIANPYPSNIDFDKLYADNSTNIYHTASFWTNVYPNTVMQGTNYPSQYLGVDYYNNYAIYNGSGGVGPTSTAPDNLIPNNIIKVGQGFMIKAKPAGANQNLVIKNSIRTNDNNGRFYNAKIANTNVIDRYWLRLSSPLGVNNDILVAYKKGATNDYEIDYDAKMMANPPDAFYSILDDNKLVIQGRAYPLNIQDKVTLGARFYQPGNYKISILQKEGIFANTQEIYIKDKLENKVVNLQEQDYTFNISAEGNITDRFEIVYRPEFTMGTDQVINRGDAVVYYDHDYFSVEVADKITEIVMYDTTGKLITRVLPNASKAKISTVQLPKGVYLLNIKMTDKLLTKKVIK